MNIPVTAGLVDSEPSDGQGSDKGSLYLGPSSEINSSKWGADQITSSMSHHIHHHHIHFESEATPGGLPWCWARIGIGPYLWVFVPWPHLLVIGKCPEFSCTWTIVLTSHFSFSLFQF